MSRSLEDPSRSLPGHQCASGAAADPAAVEPSRARQTTVTIGTDADEGELPEAAVAAQSGFHIHDAPHVRVAGNWPAQPVVFLHR